MFKINRKRLKNELMGSFMIIILLSILFFLFGAIMFGVEGAKIGDILFFAFIFWLLAIIFLISGIRGIKRYWTEMKQLDYLEQHGKSIRDLKYSLIEFKRMRRHRNTIRVSADYELESGSVVKFVSNRHFFTSDSKGRDTVDVLFAPNDINNYYIGFDIEEV